MSSWVRWWRWCDRSDGDGEAWQLLEANHSAIEVRLKTDSLTVRERHELSGPRAVVVPDSAPARRGVTVRVADGGPGGELLCGFPHRHPYAAPCALAKPKVVEREKALDLLDANPEVLAGRAGQVLMADKRYASTELGAGLADPGMEAVRPARRDERLRRGARQFKPLRQIIESVHATLKTELSVERHGAHSH